MAVAWYVNHLKVSPKDQFLITIFTTYLDYIYGYKMEVWRGEVHKYLVMVLDYSKKVSVKVSIINYIVRILKYFPEEIKSYYSSPEA